MSWRSRLRAAVGVVRGRLNHFMPASAGSVYEDMSASASKQVLQSLRLIGGGQSNYEYNIALTEAGQLMMSCGSASRDLA